MNILLINTNPVVSRLVSLCMRDESISYEEVDRIAEVSDTRYDIVFIDDASYSDETAQHLGTMAIGKVVFLSGRDAGEEIGSRFDSVIKKPFLPSQIQAVIDSVATVEPVITPEDAVHPESEHFIFPLASSEEKEEANETAEETVDEGPLALIGEAAQTEESGEEKEAAEKEPPMVLDSDELEQIKALLEDSEEELPLLDLEDEAEIEARKVEVITRKLEEDGLEIVEEEKIIEALSEKPKEKKKKRGKSKKSKKKKDDEVYTFEEALLAAVENMKPKKIKKLLKGAEVTIKIRFKDSE